ncbi:MAG: FHA domain-containing protein [Candidatus Vecturithrix sp.]|jgi:pSer/pThr/pTyr-binding forkhead associated (FHA) protein|nr:FHA domain-containing protein [Candidatus Vecturithrix sp.]
MMNFLKKSYRQRAIQEEAKGNYTQAAAFYSKAEEFEKVGEMHELLGDFADTFPAKIRAYQQALRWYRQPDHQEPLAYKLAEIMEADIRADATVSAIESRRLPMVAEYYALAKKWKKAGNLYEELGMYEKATEMYIQGGEVEHVEQISVRKDDRFQRTYSAQQLYDEAETAYRCGQRDKAYHLLKQGITFDPNATNARNLFDKLVRAFQPTDRLRVYLFGEEQEYVLFGKPIITLGRKEDNDIVLDQHDVSRYHARIGLQGQNCVLEDLQSSNGTRMNGLRIQKNVSIHHQDVIGLGLHRRFNASVFQYQSGTALLLQETQSTMHHLLFAGELQVGFGSACALRLPQLPRALSECLFKVKYQQPYWYWRIHPQLSQVELNGVPVTEYVVIVPGDALRFAATTLLFE